MRRTDEEGQRRFVPAVDRHINRIATVFAENEALEVDDEVGDGGLVFIAKLHVDVPIQGRNDGLAVFIHNIDADRMVALFDAGKSEAQHHGARGMGHRNFRRPDAVERAEHIQLALVFRGRVAQRDYFNVHARRS